MKKVCEEKFEDILEKYSDTVTRILIMNLRNEEDAKDCYQEVFIKLYKRKWGFKDENHLKYWLIRVAINTCIDYQRKNYKSSIDIENVVVKSYDQYELIPNLLNIKKEYRNVLYLYYYQGYKIREIANLLHQNENTIKTWMKRGKGCLKKEMGGDYNE